VQKAAKVAREEERAKKVAERARKKEAYNIVKAIKST